MASDRSRKDAGLMVQPRPRAPSWPDANSPETLCESVGLNRTVNGGDIGGEKVVMHDTEWLGAPGFETVRRYGVSLRQSSVAKGHLGEMAAGGGSMGEGRSPEARNVFRVSCGSGSGIAAMSARV